MLSHIVQLRLCISKVDRLSGELFNDLYFLSGREDFPGQHPPVCCTASQVQDMGTNFALAAPMLDRCPTCYYNFRINFCDMTCRPDQSKFLKVTKFINGTYEPCHNEMKSAPPIDNLKRKKIFLFSVLYRFTVL